MAKRLWMLMTVAGFAAAQTNPPADLTQATLEQLMNIQVTSASKKEQRLSNTAASVYVITAEDIRRSGLQTLPEILRLAPGVTVTRTNAGTWAISIRGFTDEFANKLLVLIDGRSIYSELFSGVLWDTQQVAPDEIDRIEVIRGAAAAMWGTNAVNGVINIITKKVEATQGGSVTASSGTAGETNVSARYGGEWGSKLAYRVTFRDTNADQFPSAEGAAPAHGWDTSAAGFRVEWTPDAQDSLMFSGQADRSNVGHLFTIPSLANPLAPPVNAQEQTSDADLLTRWEHTLAGGSTVEVQASWTYSGIQNPQVPVHYNIGELEIKHHVALGSRQDVIWGLDVRQANYSFSNEALYRINTTGGSGQNVYAIFAEDEITLVPEKLHFIIGAQTGYTSFTGFEIQPTGRLLWTPTRKMATWASVSRAERSPSLYELGIDTLESSQQVAPGTYAYLHILGTPTFRSETVLAYEAGQRLQMGERWWLDVSGFYNVYRHLQGLTIGVPAFIPPTATQPFYLEIPATLGNLRHGDTYGGEASVTWAASQRWKLTSGYSAVIVDTRAYSGIAEDTLNANTATPRHQVQAHSNYDLTRKVQIDAALYFNTSSSQPVSLFASANLPAHVRGDLRIPLLASNAKIGSFRRRAGRLQLHALGIRIQPFPRTAGSPSKHLRRGHVEILASSTGFSL